MAIRMHDCDNIESIKIKLKDYPKAYQAKVEELMEQCGESRESAEKIADCEIDLEIYYHKGLGLFAIESEACENCESGGLTSPYDPNEELLGADEYDEQMLEEEN